MSVKVIVDRATTNLAEGVGFQPMERLTMLAVFETAGTQLFVVSEVFG